MNEARQLPAHVDGLSLLPRVCELWCEVLGQRSIDPDQHFFLAGGDSLQMMRLLMRLQSEWQVELQLAQLWQFSTPRKMAFCCSEEIVQMHCREPEPALCWNTSDFPASCSQQGLWISELHADNQGLYNSAVLLELHGTLIVPVLEQALQALRLQFPLLQSRLQPALGGRHLRVMIAPHQSLELNAEPLPHDVLQATASSLLMERFELGLGLWRCRLYRHADDWHSLLLCGHHCLVDGWSGAVLLRQLALSYNALLANAKWSPTFADTAFASHCWRQQQYLCSDTHAENLQWWKQRLAPVAPLPATIPWQADAEHWPYRLRSSTCLWPATELQLLLQRCADSEVTLFAALLTALACALVTVSGHQEHVIAFPVAGRSLAEEEQSVGCYMSLLPIHLVLERDESLQKLLLRVQREATQVQAHAAPWQSLVQALHPSPLADGNAWTEVVLALQNFPTEAVSFAGLRCQQQLLPSLYGQQVLKFEMTVTDAGLQVQVFYAEAVLSAAVVEQLVSSMLSRLQALVL